MATRALSVHSINKVDWPAVVQFSSVNITPQPRFLLEQLVVDHFKCGGLNDGVGVSDVEFLARDFDAAELL
jgi:hypothetical protein